MNSLKKNFTLVELLVVIAIIAILASMLLPTLNKAMESGRSAKCIGNLKQISLSTMTYVNDNKDYLPISLSTLPAGTPAVYPWVTLAEKKYVTNTKIYDCPSDITRRPSMNTWVSVAARTGDFYNGHSWRKGANIGFLWSFCYGDVLTAGFPPRKIGSLKKIQFDMLTLDGETHNNSNGYYYAVSLSIPNITDKGDWTRHSGKKGNVYAGILNAAIADGSVRRLSYSDWRQRYYLKGDY